MRFCGCAHHRVYEAPADGRDWCFHILAKNATAPGAGNAFDSHTIYTAWPGGALAGTLDTTCSPQRNTERGGLPQGPKSCTQAPN